MTTAKTTALTTQIFVSKGMSLLFNTLSRFVIPFHPRNKACLVDAVLRLVIQSCLTLCNSMGCSLPGSSVHGILQARILEWVATLFSRGYSWPRDQIRVSHIAGRFFTIWATKEGWALKNQWFWIVTLEKTLKSLLDNKEIKPVNPKWNQLWIFIGRTDADVEAPILWLPEAKSRLIGQDLDAGKDWGQEEKRTAEDEIIGWHDWLNGDEFEQNPGDSEGQGSLACCTPWGLKESDTT